LLYRAVALLDPRTSCEPAGFMPCWLIRGVLASARDADLATPDWELP
jgi:hypothetical protein